MVLRLELVVIFGRLLGDGCNIVCGCLVVIWCACGEGVGKEEGKYGEYSISGRRESDVGCFSMLEEEWMDMVCYAMLWCIVVVNALYIGGDMLW